MTEAEWLDREVPFWRLLEYVCRQGGLDSTGAGARKLRLFACACARQVLFLCQGVPVEAGAPAWRQVLEIAERVAEGLVPPEHLAEIGRTHPPRSSLRTAADVTAQVAHCLCDRSPADAAWATSALAAHALRTGQMRKAWGVVLREQVGYCRDVFGNPFRTASVDPAWLAWNAGCVLRMALGVHDEGAFDHLPILHDALLDAGCDDEDILAHCRGDGPHVRGCWVIDLLLGKK